MNLKLLDTGYVSTDTVDSQTQLGDTDRAGYTGAAVSSITLKIANLNLGGNVKLESKPIINNLIEHSTSLVSVQNRIIGVTAILQKDIITANWETNNVYQLSQMERTRGLKLLYPDSTSDSKKTIVEALGAINTGKLTSADGFANASASDDNGTVSTSTPYLVGRVSNFTIADNPTGDYWRVSFNFEISG